MRKIQFLLYRELFFIERRLFSFTVKRKYVRFTKPRVYKTEENVFNFFDWYKILDFKSTKVKKHTKKTLKFHEFNFIQFSSH